MMTLILKETNEFLDSLIGYLVVGVFLTLNGILLWVYPQTSVLEYGYVSLDILFDLGPYVLMFLIAAITMRSFTEEKKMGTLELLFTLPFSRLEILVAKYFAALFLVIISLLPTGVYYYTLYLLGNPPGNLDTPGIMGSYLGLLMLGSVFVAMGMFCSAVSHNQIVAFLTTFALCFLLYSGYAYLNVFSENSLFFFEQISLIKHYSSMQRGVIDMVDLVFFLGVNFLFLLPTYQKIKKYEI